MPLSSLWGDESCESHSDGENAPSESQLEANRERTRKARETRALNRLRRQVGVLQEQKGERSEISENWASRIQTNYFTPSFKTVASSTRQTPFSKPDYKQVGKERARAVMSFLVQLVHLIERILSPPGGTQEIHQVLDCIVMDDSSTRLRSKSDNMANIYSVMNTVQTLHVAHQNKDSSESVLIPTPFACLMSQRKEDVAAGFERHLVLHCKGIGKCLESLADLTGVGRNKLENLVKSCRWRTQIFVGDALPTNDAVYRLQKQQLMKLSPKRHLSLRVRCILHQICLVRRPAVLSIDSFWTTLVRLGHLFEQASFKKQFATAMVQVFHKAGNFQRS